MSVIGKGVLRSHSQNLYRVTKNKKENETAIRSAQQRLSVEQVS